MKTLMIGSTGSLGLALTKFLLQNKEELILLVRSKNTDLAIKKIEKKFGGDFLEQYKNQLVIVQGDLKNLEQLNKYKNEIDKIINSSGDIFLGDGEYDRLYRTNCLDLQNFLRYLKKFENLKYIMHTSTYYISDIFYGFPFVNHYEQTKIIGENIVYDYGIKNNLNFSIIRPSIIIGNSKTGKISNCSGYCTYLEILNRILRKNTDKIFLVPGKKDMPVNIIFIDWLVEQIYIIFKNEYTGSFNLANQNPPKFGWLLENSLELLHLQQEKILFLDDIEDKKTKYSNLLIKLGLDVFKEYTSRPEVLILNPKIKKHPQIQRWHLKKQIEFYKKFYKTTL